MTDNLTFELLSTKDIAAMAVLGKEYNQKLTIHIIEGYLREMFSFGNYYCFGALQNEKLVGFASGWITIKFNTGKELALDNVVISHLAQSQEFGIRFFAFIELWAKENGCKVVEIDSRLHNPPIHKFLINLDYSIAGFHFQKLI